MSSRDIELETKDGMIQLQREALDDQERLIQSMVIKYDKLAQDLKDSAELLDQITQIAKYFMSVNTMQTERLSMALDMLNTSRDCWSELLKLTTIQSKIITTQGEDMSMFYDAQRVADRIEIMRQEYQNLYEFYLKMVKEHNDAAKNLPFPERTKLLDSYNKLRVETEQSSIIPRTGDTKKDP